MDQTRALTCASIWFSICRLNARLLAEGNPIRDEIFSRVMFWSIFLNVQRPLVGVPARNKKRPDLLSRSAGSQPVGPTIHCRVPILTPNLNLKSNIIPIKPPLQTFSTFRIRSLKYFLPRGGRGRSLQKRATPQAA